MRPSWHSLHVSRYSGSALTPCQLACRASPLLSPWAGERWRRASAFRWQRSFGAAAACRWQPTGLGVQRLVENCPFLLNLWQTRRGASLCK